MASARGIDRIGGTVRWEDEAATGYVFSSDPETNVPIPDVNRPHFDDGLFSGDLWLNYGRKINHEKIEWSVRLNVRNLVGESGNIPVKTNPGATQPSMAVRCILSMLVSVKTGGAILPVLSGPKTFFIFETSLRIAGR